MAVLSANVDNLRVSTPDMSAVDVYQSTTIYKGSWVCINSSGYAIAAADTAGNRAAGLASDQANNSSGSSGDIKVALWTGGGIEAAFDAITQADVGRVCFVLDSGALTLNNSVNNIGIAILREYISSTLGRVEIAPGAGGGAAGAAADDTELYKVDANKVIVSGTILMADTAVGDVMPGADTASMRAVGVALEAANNTGGASGDVLVNTRTRGKQTCTATGADDTWIGQSAHVTAANTVALSSSNEVYFGTIRNVISATSVVVEFSLSRIPEVDVLHVTGDGTEVKTYTDADTTIIKTTGYGTEIKTYTDADATIFKTTGMGTEFKAYSDAEATLIHTTGDGADVKTYTDADATIVKSTGDGAIIKVYTDADSTIVKTTGFGTEIKTYTDADTTIFKTTGFDSEFKTYSDAEATLIHTTGDGADVKTYTDADSTIIKTTGFTAEVKVYTDADATIVKSTGDAAIITTYTDADANIIHATGDDAEFKAYSDAEATLIHTTGDSADIKTYTDAEATLIHTTGDGADVKTYTDLDTDLFPMTVDVVRICDAADIGNINILPADKHPDMQLIEARAVLVEVPDAAGDTLTVTVKRGGDNNSMTDVTTFTEGVDNANDLDDLTVHGSDHTILTGDFAYIVVGGTTSTLGQIQLRLTWQFVR